MPKIAKLARILAALTPFVLKAQTLAPTPPMGWNSWDSYGLSVTQDEFKANADYLAKNLLRHGWEYAVVDEGWYLQNPEGKAGTFRFTMDANGRYTPALNRFPAGSRPGFTDLADWVHTRKMKFGIHIIRGIPREAVERNLPIVGSQYYAADAANKSDTCRWNADNYGLKANAAGQAYYDSIAALYAGWGVDYVKIDCISAPYLGDEIRMFSEALRKTGRPIILSLSPGPTPLDQAENVRKYAQLWRISGDVWDHWQQLPKQEWTQGRLAQFQLIAKWAPHAGAGHWPDADMLPIGSLGPRPGFGKTRPSAFTHDEQRTLMTLWSMARSPLFMGGNLTKMDEWTTSLLTNEEVLAADQHSTGRREVLDDGMKAVWIAKAGTRDSFYIALFNLSDAPQTVTYPLQSILMNRTSSAVRNLWEHKELIATDVLKAQLPPHASALFRLNP